MNDPIRIKSSFIEPNSIKNLLEEYLVNESDITLKLQERPEVFRDLNPQILIALVGMAGTGLGALISGLSKIISQKYGSYIEIQAKDWSVKVPSTISKKELNDIIEIAQSKNIELIKIIK